MPSKSGRCSGDALPLNDNLVYVNRLDSPFTSSPNQRHRESTMQPYRDGRRYNYRTPSPANHYRQIKPQSKEYTRALLADEEDDVLYEEPERSEILDKYRKSYSLPMRQSLAIYDDTDTMDYEIPREYLAQKDPYGVKQEKARERPYDAIEADASYDRLVNRPKRPGLSPRRNHYDYYYYIDEEEDPYTDHRHHRSSSADTRRSQSALEDMNDDHYLKSYFRNFRGPSRRYDTDGEYSDVIYEGRPYERDYYRPEYEYRSHHNPSDYGRYGFHDYNDYYDRNKSRDYRSGNKSFSGRDSGDFSHSRSSQLGFDPPHGGRESRSTYGRRNSQRSNDYDSKTSLTRQDSHGRSNSSSHDLENTHKDKNQDTHQDAHQDAQSNQPTNKSNAEKRFEPYQREHEIMSSLRKSRRTRDFELAPPDPMDLKNIYVYKTRGPDRLEIFDRDNEVADYNREDTYRAPTCDIKLRSHTVWEKMYVKFTCTVKGKPLPKIIWYKDMIPIQRMVADAGHVKITSQYGVHTLEIYRARLDDSGTYRISAQNCKGEVSSFATLVVRRYQPGRMGYHEIKTGLHTHLSYQNMDGLDVQENTEKDLIEKDEVKEEEEEKNEIKIDEKIEEKIIKDEKEEELKSESVISQDSFVLDISDKKEKDLKNETESEIVQNEDDKERNEISETKIEEVKQDDKQLEEYQQSVVINDAKVELDGSQSDKDAAKEEEVHQSIEEEVICKIESGEENKSLEKEKFDEKESNKECDLPQDEDQEEADVDRSCIIEELIAESDMGGSNSDPIQKKKVRFEDNQPRKEIKITPVEEDIIIPEYSGFDKDVVDDDFTTAVVINSEDMIIEEIIEPTKKEINKTTSGEMFEASEDPEVIAIKSLDSTEKKERLAECLTDKLSEPVKDEKCFSVKSNTELVLEDVIEIAHVVRQSQDSQDLHQFMDNDENVDN